MCRCNIFRLQESWPVTVMDPLKRLETKEISKPVKDVKICPKLVKSWELYNNYWGSRGSSGKDRGSVMAKKAKVLTMAMWMYEREGIGVGWQWGWFFEWIFWVGFWIELLFGPIQWTNEYIQNKSATTSRGWGRLVQWTNFSSCFCLFTHLAL